MKTGLGTAAMLTGIAALQNTPHVHQTSSKQVLQPIQNRANQGPLQSFPSSTNQTKTETKTETALPNMRSNPGCTFLTRVITAVGLPFAKYALLTPWMPTPIQRQTLNLASLMILPKKPGLEVQKQVPLGQGLKGNIVKGTVIRADNAQESKGVVLYLHGGAYKLCSPGTHQALCQEITERSGFDSIIPDYSRAPEASYPEAIEECVSVYKTLLKRYPNQKILISGDSAGGGLAVMLLNKIESLSLKRPAGTVLLSPWIDVDPENLSNTYDPLISKPFLREASRQYLKGASIHKANPVNVPTKHFPPQLIITAGKERLKKDSIDLHQRALNSGVDSQLEIWDNLFHAFPIFPMLPEADKAIDQICQFTEALN